MIRPSAGRANRLGGILGSVNGISLTELVRIGEGREAEVFALDSDRALRLARNASFRPVLERERAALVAAAAAGVPAPAVFGPVEVDGRSGLIVGRLGSRNLLFEVAARPWRVVTIGRELGSLHALMHRAVAPDSLEEVHDLVGSRLESPLVPGRVRERALGLLDALPRGDRLCHGDFHPGNVLRGADGGAAAIDWTGACRGDPAADVARSRLIIRFGALGPDATFTVAALALVGRPVLWRAYLGGYRRAGQMDRGAVERWLPVMAAARLAEDIAEERPRLLKMALA